MKVRLTEAETETETERLNPQCLDESKLRGTSKVRVTARGSPGSRSGPVAAGTGERAGDARRVHPHLGEQGARGGDSGEASSALETEDGPGTGQVSSGSRIGRECDGSAAERAREFRASTAVGDTGPNGPGQACAGSPLPVMPVPQVNVCLVKTLKALTGIIENMWDPDAGQPPDHLIEATQDSRAILQTSSAILSQEGGAALDAEQDPELWNLDEDEAEQMEEFEEAHAPGQGHAKPQQSAHRRKRVPRSRGLRNKEVLRRSRSKGCQHEPCRIPETRNFWPSRSEHACSSQP